MRLAAPGTRELWITRGRCSFRLGVGSVKGIRPVHPRPNSPHRLFRPAPKPFDARILAVHVHLIGEFRSSLGPLETPLQLYQQVQFRSVGGAVHRARTAQPGGSGMLSKRVVLLAVALTLLF